LVDPKASFVTFPICDGDQAPGETAHIDVPLVSRLRTPATQFVGILLSELQRPTPHRFVAESNATRCHEFFDISKTQGKSKVEPNRMRDNFGGVV